MRKFIVISLILFGFVLVSAEEKKSLTFDQAFGFGSMGLLNPVPLMAGWTDDSHYLAAEGQKLMKVHALSGETETVLDASEHKEAVKKGFSLLPGRFSFFFGSSPHLHTGDRSRFVTVSRGDIFLYLKNEKKIIRITDTTEEESIPAISPDGNHVAFNRGANLFVYDVESGKTRQLTRDGSDNILNGYASWIYYEEVIGRSYKSYWWSPDSNHIAFIRYDQTAVPVFHMSGSKGIYGYVEKQRYPKPGFPNPTVKLGIISAETGKTTWVPFSDPEEHYLAHPKWSEDGSSLYFQWKNRGQDRLKLLAYHLKKGKLETRYQEHQKTWVDFIRNSSLYILKNRSVILPSSKTGWNHIYRVKPGGKAVQITRGNWAVSSINHVDEKNRTIFFTARKEDSTETHFYRTSFSGKIIKKLTPARGSHRVTVSKGGSYFYDTYSATSHPNVLELRNSHGKLIRKLGSAHSKRLDQINLAKIEIFRIKTADGYRLPVLWYLPPNMDKTKKHPVIFSVYGGPGSMGVRNGWGFRGFGNHFLAQQGIIVLTTDHRGSGHFGKKGIDLMHRQLGKWEINDYVEVVKYLRTLPFVDGSKIGITGGSYGGYVSALALTRASEYFQFGIAHSSVIDYKLYDSIYTERYMDTPEENPEGYKQTSVLTYVKNYRGGLRLTHGSMDDNVHMQNTIQLMDAITDTGKEVELLIYPGERHGYRRKRNHSNRTSFKFWMKHFFNK